MSIRRLTLRKLVWIVVGSLLVGVTQAQAESHQARDWVERAAVAQVEQSFIGDFVYQHGGQMQTMRIWHAGGLGEGVRQRILSLSGDPREFLRSKGRVACTFAGEQSLVVEQRQLQAALGDLIPTDVSRLLPHYGLVMIGSDRIASRPVVGVAVQSADAYRYGYELWFDEQTGLLLGTELINDQGEVIERVMMLDIRLQESIAEADLAPTLSGEGFTWLTHPVESDGALQPPEGVEAQWDVGDLPAGFTLDMDRMQMLPGKDSAVRHLLFSDGLASVSVYIEPSDHQDRVQGASQIGALNAYSRDITGHRITAVGEVPGGTVENMAHALQPRSTGNHSGEVQ